MFLILLESPSKTDKSLGLHPVEKKCYDLPCDVTSLLSKSLFHYCIFIIYLRLTAICMYRPITFQNDNHHEVAVGPKISTSFIYIFA